MACSQYKKDEVQVIFDRSLAKVSSFKPGKMQSGKRDFPLRKLGKKYTILEAKGGSYVKKVADLTGPEIFEKYAGADEIVKLGLKAGHARRVIPLLDNNVINALSAACANATPNTLLFPGEDGPLNEKAVNKRLHKMAKMADIAQSKAHAHVLRHTFGVWAAKKGMNIVMIARLMGHGTPEKPRIETTAIYQQFAIEDLRDDMRKRGIGF
jgi:integrase